MNQLGGPNPNPCMYTASDMRDAYERGRQHTRDEMTARRDMELWMEFERGRRSAYRSFTRVFLAGVTVGGVLVALLPVLT